jgi:hypothetical protein
MKDLKTYLFIVIALILFFGGLMIGCNHNKSDFKQSNSNQITKDSSREVLYTTEEVHQFLQDHDSAILANLKPKYIDRLIKLKLTYSDSVGIANYFKPKEILPDSEYSNIDYDVRFFDVEKDCYKISGISYPDTTILQTDFSTEITTVLYVKYKYPTWFKRLTHLCWSNYNDCISLMNCNGDSLNVQNNIKVIRK